jgi:hypothetical protein
MNRRRPTPSPRPAAIAWGPTQLGWRRYSLLGLCVAGQWVTVAITWPLWQARVDPPNLPLWNLPGIDFGWLMLVSLLAVMVYPRWGLVAHAAVLLAACLFDQMRTQPQLLALLVLMAGCVSPAGARACRWFLATLWFWAGLHKALSPDWFGQNSWQVATWLGLDAAGWHMTLAVAVAAGELVLGIAACWRPRVAAGLCVAVHVGIALLLSPALGNWNVSVLPWNLATAVVGAWLLWHAEPGLPQLLWERCVAAALLILPAGFYLGWVDHGVASVLYSDNLPRAAMTTRAGTEEILGWGELHVPFPNERRLLRMRFERSAEPGDKLHVADPRPWLADQYFVLGGDGWAREIDAEAFFAAGAGEVAGVGLDSRRSQFALFQAGAKMLKRSEQSMIYAVEIPPERFHPALLAVLPGLPNLEQLQLAGCALRDDDLRQVARLERLKGLGLNRTPVGDAGLAHLKSLPRLKVVEHEQTGITPEGLRQLPHLRER